MNDLDYERVEKAIGYTFKDKTLLKRALTLSSYDAKNNNQKLEFLGDAILEFIVSEIIFERKETEGELTDLRKSLVADSALKPVSQKIGLDVFLIKGEGDRYNKKAVPSAYEAVCAAIYLDGGLPAVKKFVSATLDFNVKEIINYKGLLQEYMQRKAMPCPKYVCEEMGTEQNHRFLATLTVEGETYCGEGANKKIAEQYAAKLFLERFNLV